MAIIDLKDYVIKTLVNDATLQSYNVNVVPGGVDKAQSFPAITVVLSSESQRTVPPNAWDRVFQVQVWVTANDNGTTESTTELEKIVRQVVSLLEYNNTNTDYGQVDNVRIYWSKVKQGRDIHDSTRNLLSKPLQVLYYSIG
jgi:hypothetical protein